MAELSTNFPLTRDEMLAHRIPEFYSETEVLKETADQVKRYDRRHLKQAAQRLSDGVERWQGKNDWRLLKGARLLEIASGGKGGSRIPYFAELAVVNGATVTTIDLLSQAEIDKKLFTHIQADVVDLVARGELSNLPGLGGAKFDIISSTDFVGENPHPEALSQIHAVFRGKTKDDTTKYFELLLVEQLKPLVNEGGIIDLDLGDLLTGDWVFYKNTGGKFEEQRIMLY